jgi:hypothetical protein
MAGALVPGVSAWRHPLPWSRLVCGVWLGVLLCIGLLAAPAAFAVLDKPSAGRLVGALFAREAATSVVLGALLMLLQRWQVRQDAPDAAAHRSAQATERLLLPAGAVFCTVLGYYALQPMMEQARAGVGALGFGQLHAISVGFFALKLLLVAVLAVRLSQPPASSS